MSPSIIASFIYFKSFSTGTLCNKVNWKIVNGETNIYINRFCVVAIVCIGERRCRSKIRRLRLFLKEITFKLQRLSQMYKAYLRFSLKYIKNQRHYKTILTNCRQLSMFCCLILVTF